MGRPQITKRERVGYLDGLYQRNRSFTNGGKRRSQQSELGNARLLNQQLNERANRPAAAREFGRHRCITLFHDASKRTCELRSSLQRAVDIFRFRGSHLRLYLYIHQHIGADLD